MLETPIKELAPHDRILSQFFHDLSGFKVFSENTNIDNTLLNEWTDRYLQSSPFLLKANDRKMFKFYFDLLGYSDEDRNKIFQAVLMKEFESKAFKQ